jgi:hypothetical protein
MPAYPRAHRQKKSSAWAGGELSESHSALTHTKAMRPAGRIDVFIHHGS